MTRSLALLSAAALVAGAIAFTAPSWAQATDSAISAARAAGQVGEQADGYLGFVPGATISADLRGRVEQNNIRRRALYTQRATQRNASVNEMAAAVACEVFQRPRIAVGEKYRNEAGQWRQRTAGAPIDVPSFCSE